MMIRTLIPLLLGVIIGLPPGLYYAWEVEPVEYVQTAPQSLRSDYRRIYLSLIAQAHAATGDTERAAERLAVFQSDDIGQELTSLAQREAAQGGPAARAQALARLAEEIAQIKGQISQVPAGSTGSAAAARATTSPPFRSTSTNRPTRPATLTDRLSPSASPTEMVIYTYTLTERAIACPGPTFPPEIMVEITDEGGDPVPGVRLTVLWDEGQDRFYTGLQPQVSPGYADFEMEVGVDYALQVEDSPLLVIDISSESCRWENGLYPGSVRLVIERSPSGS